MPHIPPRKRLPPRQPCSIEATAVACLPPQVVRLWVAAAGQLKAALEGHRQAVHSLAFSPSGLLLASGSEDYMVGGGGRVGWRVGVGGGCVGWRAGAEVQADDQQARGRQGAARGRAWGQGSVLHGQ